MKKLKLLLMLALCSSMALGVHVSANMSTKRVHVVKAYLHDLQMANADAIGALFVSNGTVVSTSQGLVDARNFFHQFLPAIDTAHVNVNHIYKSVGDRDHYSAGFQFKWKMRDGSQSGGHYVDEFIFKKGSSQLQSVIMYENVKLPLNG